MSTDVFSVIKKPLVTEKNTAHISANVYAFEVDSSAGKVQIAKAVEKAFKVKVVEVNTMNCRGRERRMGRFLSRVGHYKKALVRVADGQKIKIFEGA
jgi:large subunit ribosomal protein L23